jgi:hypothetical protein
VLVHLAHTGKVFAEPDSRQAFSVREKQKSSRTGCRGSLFPVVQDANRITEPVNFVPAVGYIDGRAPKAARASDSSSSTCIAGNCQRGQGLVQQQHLRLAARIRARGVSLLLSAESWAGSLFSSPVRRNGAELFRHTDSLRFLSRTPAATFCATVICGNRAYC